jgi:hypothetical protein
MERDGQLRILSPEMAIKQAQALVRRYVPAGTCLSEELLRERRADALAENATGPDAT